METLALAASTFCPTSPRTGLSGTTILRCENIILTGQSPDIYLAAYKGSLDMDETIPSLAATGTVSGAEGEYALVGVGTTFTTELRSGDRVWLGDDPYMVNVVTDATHLTVYQALVDAASAATLYRLPIINEMARQRATQIQGNTIQFDKGSIVGVGWGTLRVNGDVLQGASMVLTGSPQLALFDPTTGDYSIEDVGFDTPTVAPTLTEDLGSGTVGMQAGDYSIRLVPSSSITGGYSNPGPRADVTLTTENSRIKVDVNSVAFPAGADQWDVYGTQLGVVVAKQGPWNFVRSVLSTEIAGGIFYIEYLNAEIARQGELDFDNDPPPDAGLLATLQGYPQWISCNGKFGGSPGPELIPATPQNLEGAPAIWTVTSSPPEDILGVITSLARLYLLCPKSLQQAVFAPTNDPLIPPTQIRAYWSMGFGNPYQLIFVLGLLIGYASGGPTRSTADIERSDDQFIGANVIDLTDGTIQANWMVAYDPDLNAVCFFYPANGRNDDGWLTTEVLIWGLDYLDWIGRVVISDATRDMAVCGVATVDNQLYFLAGGEGDGIGSIQFDTFVWNSASGDEVNYYAAWELQATSTLNQNKSVRAAKVSGKLTNGQFMLYGYDSNEAVDLTNLEAGNNPSIQIALGTSTSVKTSFRIPFNSPNNFMFSPRVSGTYNGVDEAVDRINGVILEYFSSGVRR